jgi:CO/xanthine dehydrogenase Mo-binding subunit
VLEAAQDVVDQLRKIAADMVGEPAARLTVVDGAVVGGGRRLAYPDLLDHHFGMRGGELIGRGVVAPGRTKAALGGSTPFWEVAMGGAEISLDEETGAIAIESYASVSDVGRCINPQQCAAQDEGAVMQGLGHTLLEEMVYEGGQLLNADLAGYRVPRARAWRRSSWRTATAPAPSAPRVSARAASYPSAPPSATRWRGSRGCACASCP